MQKSRKKFFKKFLPLITFFFFILVVYLLHQSLSNIEWDKVSLALQNVPVRVLLVAAAMVGVNYAVLASYDFIGLKHLQVPGMGYPRVFISAFICYALTLNIGALVGGLGFRYRIYSGWNVDKKKIPVLIFFSTLTNWLGYTFLLGTAFLFKSESMAAILPLPLLLIKGLGFLAWGVVMAYFILSYQQKDLRIKTHQLEVPAMPLALLQLLLSTFQWSLLAGIIYFILIALGSSVEYSQIMVTLLLASIAGVITHIPAGLGVLETVFLRMQMDVPKADLFVSLICFRAVYYILPLLIALPSYFSMEIYQKKKGTRVKGPQEILSH